MSQSRRTQQVGVGTLCPLSCQFSPLQVYFLQNVLLLYHTQHEHDTKVCNGARTAVTALHTKGDTFVQFKTHKRRRKKSTLQFRVRKYLRWSHKTKLLHKLLQLGKKRNQLKTTSSTLWLNVALWHPQLKRGVRASALRRKCALTQLIPYPGSVFDRC